MGRPRKWASNTERMAAIRESKRTTPVRKCADIPSKRTHEPVNAQSKRTELQPPSKRTQSIWYPEISQDRFKGVGRGIPVDGYVLVSRKSEPNGNTEQGIVDVETWRAKLDRVCNHGLAGWSCKACLPA